MSLPSSRFLNIFFLTEVAPAVRFYCPYVSVRPASGLVLLLPLPREYLANTSISRCRAARRIRREFASSANTRVILAYVDILLVRFIRINVFTCCRERAVLRER